MNFAKNLVDRPIRERNPALPVERFSEDQPAVRAQRRARLRQIAPFRRRRDHRANLIPRQRQFPDPGQLVTQDLCLDQSLPLRRKKLQVAQAKSHQTGIAKRKAVFGRRGDRIDNAVQETIAAIREANANRLPADHPGNENNPPILDSPDPTAVRAIPLNRYCLRFPDFRSRPFRLQGNGGAFF